MRAGAKCYSADELYSTNRNCSVISKLEIDNIFQAKNVNSVNRHISLKSMKHLQNEYTN